MAGTPWTTNRLLKKSSCYVLGRRKLLRHAQIAFSRTTAIPRERFVPPGASQYAPVSSSLQPCIWSFLSSLQPPTEFFSVHIGVGILFLAG
jgi:hypothetical protein